MGLYSFILHVEDILNPYNHFINTHIEANSREEAIQKYILGDNFRNMRVAKLIGLVDNCDFKVGEHNLNIAHDLRELIFQKAGKELGDFTCKDFWASEDAYVEFIQENVSAISELVLDATFIICHLFSVKEVDIEGYCTVKAASRVQNANSSASITDD